ncbi:MAG: hypothetical protein QF488_01890 [Candidatus Nitrosopelagicus sp.]|jgi:hypothetical protein|nr:hypothetical protein [Candidatus Nitrosopelagicus sp.]
MVEKITKAKKASKKTSSTKIKKKSKAKSKNLDTYDDSGIVLIDDDLEIDTEKVSEERKAYLEESRSQDASE